MLINQLVVLLWLSSAVSLLLFLLAQYRLQGGGASIRYMRGLLLVAMLWCLGYGMQIAVSPLGYWHVFAWQVVMWAGIAPMGTLWFLFARSLSGQYFSNREQVLFFALPFLTFSMVLVNPWLELMWIDPTYNTNGYFGERGYYFWVHICYSYSLYVIGLVSILVRMLQSRYGFRAQLALISLASFVGTVTNLWYILGSSQSNFDPSPFGFTVMFCMVAVVFMQEGLTNIVPLARDLIIDIVTLGIVMIDERGRIADANWAFCKMIGRPLEEMRRRDSRVVFGDELEPLQAALRAPSRDTTLDDAKRTERYTIHLEQGRSFKVYNTPLIDNDQVSQLLRRLDTVKQQWRGQVLVIEDISKQVAQESALRRAKEKAEAANAAKNNFLATMGHELRTPMTVIRGYSDILNSELLGGLEPSVIAEAANYINKANQRLHQMVEDILRYSALDSADAVLDWQTLDIIAMVQHLCQEVQKAQPSNPALHFHLRLPEVQSLNIISDQQKLAYVIAQLLNNAYKFTPKGSIYLSLALQSHYEGVPPLADVLDKQTLVLEVVDTGIGIAADKQAYIFAPFTQEDESSTRAYGGSGLGLALCKRYVEMLGGRLEVESVQGEGSCFRLQLPLAQPAHLIMHSEAMALAT